MNAHPLIVLAAVIFVPGFMLSSVADDWSRFRGVDGAGVAEGQTIPDEIGPDKNVVWKIKVPSGISSPIVVGEKLLLTSHTKDERKVHCFNAENGDVIWERSVPKDHDEIATLPAGPSTPTPVSDGSSVYVFFPDAGVFAWSLDGTELWKKATPVSRTMHGLSGSLVCYGDQVFQVVDQLNESFVCAYDAKTGDVQWKADRVSGLTGGYSTPVMYSPNDGTSLLITTGPLEVVAYDPKTGDRIWWIVGKTNAPVSSPILRGDRLYFCEPVGEPIPMSMLDGFDRNKDSKLEVAEAGSNEAIRRLLMRVDDNWGNKDSIIDAKEWDEAFGSFAGKGGLVAVDVTGKGDVSDSHVQWTFGKTMPYIPCALVSQDSVLTVNDGGVVTTVDVTTGKQIKKGRLKQGNGQYYASPVAAGDHVVVVDTSGVVNILSNAKEWSSLSHCELGEECFATPAIAHNRLYVRTAKSLYCFGKAE